MTLCVGPSMMPTFNQNGDLVLIDNFSYKILNHKYKVGDCIICICPYNADKTICKRVTAIEGGIKLVYRSHSPYPELVTIPNGHVWIEGDNPANSTDSRSYGAVPIGIYLCIYLIIYLCI
jgi:signal peptidase I